MNKVYDFTFPKLTDSFLADADIVEIRRFDHRGREVVRVGKRVSFLPKIKVNSLKRPLVHSLVYESRKVYLVVLSPIITTKKELAGYDLVVFDAGRIYEWLKSHSNNLLFDIVEKNEEGYEFVFKTYDEKLCDGLKEVIKRNKEMYKIKTCEKYICFLKKIDHEGRFLLYFRIDSFKLNKKLIHKTSRIILYVVSSMIVFYMILYFFGIPNVRRLLRTTDSYIKEIEEKNKQIDSQRKLLNTYIQLSPDIFLVMNEKFEVILINKAGCELLCCRLDDVRGKNILKIESLKFERDELKRVLESIKKSENSTDKIGFLTKIRTGCHENRLISWSASVVRNNDGSIRFIICIGEDITEHEMRERENLKLRSAIEEATVSIMITDTEGKIEYVNPFFCSLTGYSRDEVIGKTPRIVKSGEHPKEFYENLWRTIKSGKVWKGEFHNRKKSGELYWERATISPVHDSEGNIINFIAIKEDITKLKEITEQYYQLQKIQAIGTLAGGIAHDFNNILSAMTGYIELIDLKLKKGEDVKNYIKRIKTSIKRAKELLSQILLFQEKTKT